MVGSKRGRPTILVTDARLGSAITIIRSLGRKGCQVIAADSDKQSLGFRSRYVHERTVYPAPEIAPREFVSTLVAVAQNKEVDLIIPVTDAAILPLSAARTKFDGVCKLALPDEDALDVATNKLKTIRLAEQLDVPTPRTRLVHTAEEAVEQGLSLGWPIVLKPQVSRLYRDQRSIEVFTVSYAQNAERLAEQMGRFEGRCPVLLQEYYEGIGYGIELLLHQGSPLAIFQHKRLREVPLNGGASAFRESVPVDAQLYNYALRLLQSLRWTGLAMVEFKLGRDGPKLMEINGRVWGSLPLAVRSGMNFPCRLVDLYCGGPQHDIIAPNTDYKIGVRARNLELEMLWIAQVLRGKQPYPFLDIPRRRQAIAAVLELLNPTNKFDILSLDDLQPGLGEVVHIIRKFRRKLKEAT